MKGIRFEIRKPTPGSVARALFFFAVCVVAFVVVPALLRLRGRPDQGSEPART